MPRRAKLGVHLILYSLAFPQFYADKARSQLKASLVWVHSPHIYGQLHCGYKRYCWNTSENSSYLYELLAPLIFKDPLLFVGGQLRNFQSQIWWKSSYSIKRYPTITLEAFLVSCLIDLLALTVVIGLNALSKQPDSSSVQTLTFIICTKFCYRLKKNGASA